MPQFAVYKNPNVGSREAIPFLLDIQSDLISELETRVVVPLYTAEAAGDGVLKTLTPVFEIDGQRYVMVTAELAGISRRKLGTQVFELSSKRSEIIAAIDMLITGI